MTSICDGDDCLFEGPASSFHAVGFTRGATRPFRGLSQANSNPCVTTTISIDIQFDPATYTNATNISQQVDQVMQSYKYRFQTQLLVVAAANATNRTDSALFA